MSKLDNRNHNITCSLEFLRERAARMSICRKKLSDRFTAHIDRTLEQNPDITIYDESFFDKVRKSIDYWWQCEYKSPVEIFLHAPHEDSKYLEPYQLDMICFHFLITDKVRFLTNDMYQS